MTRTGGRFAFAQSRFAPVWVGLFAALVSGALSWVPSFWSDEVATAQTTRVPLPALWRFFGSKDAVHAAYDLAMHGWAHVFGASEFALRAPSAVAVGVAAAGLVLIGRRLASGPLGVVAGVVFAVLPRTTYAGAEARSYATTAALAVVLTLVLLVALDSRRPWAFVVYAALGALCLVVFVYLGLLLVAHLAIVLISTRRRRIIAAWLAAVVGATLAASPVVAVALGQKSQVAWLASQPVVTPWTVLVEPWFESGVAAAVVGWALIAAGVVRWRRLAPVPLVAALAWVLLPTVLLLAADAAVGPLYTSRYLTFCEPGLALVLALVVVSFGRRLAVATIVLLIVASAPTWALQRGPFAKNGGSDLRQTAAVVADHAHPGDGVLFAKGRTAALDARQSLAAYPAGYAGLDDIALVTPFPASGRFADQTLPVSRLGGRLERVQTLWFVAPTLVRSCETLASAAPLVADGFAVNATYPVHRSTVCELRR